MSNAQQTTNQDIFNFDNLGDLVRTVGDCIDGKTNIKLDTNLLSNLTRDLTANIQTSVNETIKKHTENLTKSGEQTDKTPTNNVNSNTNHTNTQDTETMSHTRDDESGLLLPDTLKFTINDDDPVFRIYRFILPNIFTNDTIRVEINEQIKNRLGIHFINNSNIDAEFCRHISYRFHLNDVTQINLKSVVSYIDYDNEYILVKFLKYNSNNIDNIKEIKVVHTVNQTINSNIFD